MEMNALIEQLREAIRAGVTGKNGLSPGSLRIVIPSRHAAAACPLMGTANANSALTCLCAGDFPHVLGTAPIAGIMGKNGWLLFRLTDEWYSAALRAVQVTMPFPADDLNCHTLNRLLCMARAGRGECPADERVQRALLLTLCCRQSDAALRRAMQALDGMTRHVPPKEHAAFSAACGGVADAAARILYAALRAGE